MLDEFYSQIKTPKRKPQYIYYHPECKKCASKRALAWIRMNPEKWKPIYTKRNHEPRHKIIHKKCNEEYRKSGKAREWQQKHPDKIKQYNDRRNSTRKHEITPREWDDCRQYFNFRCAYCGKTWEQNKKETRKDLHKDHVIPDGRNDLKNCVPACQSCNSSKGELSLNNWYNRENPNYSRERYIKIYNWIRFDCRKFIKKKQPKRKYTKRTK